MGATENEISYIATLIYIAQVAGFTFARSVQAPPRPLYQLGLYSIQVSSCMTNMCMYFIIINLVRYEACREGLCVLDLLVVFKLY